MYYLYIIKSVNTIWYYVGSTSDIGKRLGAHNKGRVKSTKYRKPYLLVYSESFQTVKEARFREKQIKKNRNVKEGIISKLALSSNG